MLKQASAICQACGAEFTPKRQAQAYCSQRRRYRDGKGGIRPRSNGSASSGRLLVSVAFPSCSPSRSG
jgi:hypothetical protein